MALNFPDPNAQPIYTDSNSGLKYIWNPTVQAWESAIQPPAIVQGSAPDLDIPGFLWFNTTDSAFYIRTSTTSSGVVTYQWTQISTSQTGTGGLPVASGLTPPANPVVGELWYNSEGDVSGESSSEGGGRLYIWYMDDGGEAYWIDAAPNLSGASLTTAFVGPSPPGGNAADGALWYSTVDNNLYVFDGNSWELAVNAPAGVNTLNAGDAVSTGGLTVTPHSGAVEIDIQEATTTKNGFCRYATQSQANAGTSNSVALTPSSLQQSIDAGNYIAVARDAITGGGQIATNSEAIAGDADPTDATTPCNLITPASLKAALQAYMNPAGTILMYAGAGASAPTGYLLCDGTTYQVSTYPDLAAVIGATGASFSVPDLTGNTAPKGPIAADGKLDIDGSTNESVADFLTFNGTNNYIIKT